MKTKSIVQCAFKRVKSAITSTSAVAKELLAGLNSPCTKVP